MIKERAARHNGKIVHFDEHWLPHAACYEFYTNSVHAIMGQQLRLASKEAMNRMLPIPTIKMLAVEFLSDLKLIVQVCLSRK